MRLFNRHKHTWRPDSFRFVRYIGGDIHTVVTVQCNDPDCAVVREKTLGKIQMSDTQVINSMYAQFGVMVEKTAENKWVRV